MPHDLDRSGIRWQRDIVGEVPVRVFDAGDKSIGVVIVLPDFDWPDGDALVELGDLLAASNLSAVLPEPRAWWIDKPDPALKTFATPLEFIAREVIPWISLKQPARPLATFGVGFGGQGAFQLAYRHPQLFPIAAAVTPAFDFHRFYDSSPQLQEWFENQERARQETVTLRLHPLNWPPHQWFACPRGDWRFDGCERLASKLTSIGIPFTADLETPEGPSYRSRQLAAAVQFLAARLREPVVSREIRIGR